MQILINGSPVTFTYALWIVENQAMKLGYDAEEARDVLKRACGCDTAIAEYARDELFTYHDGLEVID